MIREMIFENYKEAISRYIGANVSLDGMEKSRLHEQLINLALADRYDVEYHLAENLAALRYVERLNLQAATREPLTNHLNHTTGLPGDWESEIDGCSRRFFEKFREIVNDFYGRAQFCDRAQFLLPRTLNPLKGPPLGMRDDTNLDVE